MGRAAADTPGFEPDPNSQGSITFYNSAGQVITSGSNLAHLFDYAVASSDATRAGTKLASTTFAFPDHTKQDSTTWFQANSSAATGFPNTTAPAPINGFGVHRPVAQAGSTEANLLALLSTTTLDTTAGFVNIVQVRLKDSGPGLGNGVLASPFWSTDILFNQANNTWTQVYPAPVTGPVSTTTTLAVSPPSPQPTGTTVTLTATVAAQSGTAAGSVQFKDGNTNIGSPVNLTSGQAQTTTSTLPAGTHTLTAAFTPSNTNAFAASTSGGTPYTITTPATDTSTALSITPPSPITAGTQSTLTATVTAQSGTPTGTVQFKDGATNIGSAVQLDGSGHAQTTTTFLANTHSVTAQFIPTESTAFNGSTSQAVSYVVNAASATTTHVTTFDVSPASSQPFGTTLTYTATVTPSGAVGHVNFLDGANVIASGTVTSGTATATSSALTGGQHTLSAQFVPDDSNAFTTSQSDTKSYTITAATTTTTLDVTPAGPVTHGSTVTLTAHVAPNAAAGSVQFFDGDTALGSSVSLTSGAASMQTTTLSASTHSLTAKFTPSDTNYAASTSSASSLQVTAQESSTTLTVAPSGSEAVEGTSETLTATITPSDASGTVQFSDGDTPIGDPAPVTGGSAQLTQALPVGTHSLTAHFISGDSTTVADSTSGAVSFVVKPQPTTTTTALEVTPAGPVTFGTAVTLKATVSPSNATGTVTFLDGSTPLGSKAVSSGVATLATVGLGGGAHSLHANFVPESADNFKSSSGDASITVDAAVTTTTLAVAPGGPVAKGTSVTLTATVTPPTAVGSVTFRNGTTELGTVAVSQGKATLTTTSLGAGTASLTATFTATHAGDFATSTSAASTLAVVGPPSISSVSANGEPMLSGTALHVGEVVTVTASGFAPGETVSITAHSTPVNLGTVRATSDGVVNVTFAVPVTLGPGSHTLTLTGKFGTATLHFTVAGSGVSGTGSGAGTSGSSGSGGGLATTGVRIASLSGAALGLIFLGAWALTMAGPRRRHRGLHRFL